MRAQSRTVIHSVFARVAILVALIFNTAIAAPPNLPRTFVDTSVRPVTGASIIVNSGDDLQAAINRASFGDEIILEAGATFVGPFLLPNKGEGSNWITIRSSAVNALPPAGTRVSPSDAVNMAKVAGAGTPTVAFQADRNAHHYRIIGLEIAPRDGQFATALNRFTFDQHHIIFDRVYCHGNERGGRRCALLNGQHMAFIDSYISNWWETGADSQALLLLEGGPTAIINNYLEGGAENILTGGGAFDEDKMISDVTIKNNLFSKPLSWWSADPSYDGVSRSIKNLLEFKSGRRILVESNTFQNFWIQEQSTAILFKSTNQGTACVTPYAQVEHITFRFNVIRGAANAIRITKEGRCPNSELDVQNILVEQNILTDINIRGNWGSGATGRFITMGGTSNNVIIRHNTAFTPEGTNVGNIAFIDGSHSDLIFEDNIVGHAAYGVKGSGSGIGSATLNAKVTNYSYTGNVQYGTSSSNNSSNYPAGNFYTSNINSIGFVSYQENGTGDYRLRSSSEFKNIGTDGKDPGVDWDAFEAAGTYTFTRAVPIIDLQ